MRLRTTPTFRRLAAALVAAASAAVLLPAPTAVAETGAEVYSSVRKRFDFVGTLNTGGYVSCPTGTSSVTSGAVIVSRPGEAALSNGQTTWERDGGYATGYAGSGDAMTLEVLCADSDRLTGSTLVTQTVFGDSTQRNLLGQASCPTGTVPYGGGSFVSRNGVPDPAGLAQFASFPKAHSWTVGQSGVLQDRPLWVSSHCLPRAQVGSLRTVTESVRAPRLDGRDAVPVYVTATCPPGTFAIAGGAWFHRPGDLAPKARGFLTGSTTGGDGTGWYAEGWARRNATVLTARMRCTDRLGVL